MAGTTLPAAQRAETTMEHGRLGWRSWPLLLASAPMLLFLLLPLLALIVRVDLPRLLNQPM